MSFRILLCTFGSLGDVHPIMALAQELKRRGHEPVIATSELYRAKIEDEGLAFHAVRPDLPSPRESGELIAKVMDAKSGTTYLFRELLIPALRDAYEDLLPLARECDLLISHPATLAAPLVAEYLKMRWLSIALAPVSVWSVHDPPIMEVVPPWLKIEPFRRNVFLQRLLKHMARHATWNWFEPYYRFQQELQLPMKGSPLLEGQHSPHGVLALFSRVLAAPQPDWPQNTTVCGACLYDKRGEIEGTAAEYSQGALHPEIQSWLARGEKPIVFTLGSAAVFDARDFFEESTQAARALNRRALLLIGHEENRPASLPHNTDKISAFDYAPFGEVFPHAAIIVHQGGAGTTAQVLQSGAPSLVMPYSHDQPDHAARLQRLGIARVIDRRHYAAPRVARELKKLLSHEIYARRAQQIASQVRKETGPQTAADAIEKVLDS